MHIRTKENAQCGGNSNASNFIMTFLCLLLRTNFNSPHMHGFYRTLFKVQSAFSECLYTTVQVRVSVIPYLH